MLWFGHNSTMIGEKFEFCISRRPINSHNANFFNLEFGHEHFTLTFPASPFKRGAPFVLSLPLLRIFFPPTPFVSEPKFFSLSFKRGGGKLCWPINYLEYVLVKRVTYYYHFCILTRIVWLNYWLWKKIVSQSFWRSLICSHQWNWIKYGFMFLSSFLGCQCFLSSFMPS